MGWETRLDLSDYASVFGVDSNEIFKLQFSYKPHKTNSDQTLLGMKNIPFEITVRLRIKSIWLKNVDNMSQASTDSMSRISSSVMSDLSDFENYKMFEHINKSHTIPFASLPEEHSIHSSPIKQLSFCSDAFLKNQECTKTILSPIEKKKNDCDSALESFGDTIALPKHVRNLSDEIVDTSTPFRVDASFSFNFQSSTRIPNLSLLLSPNRLKKECKNGKNDCYLHTI